LPSGHRAPGWAGRPTPRTAGPTLLQACGWESRAFDASPGKYGGRSKRAPASGRGPSGWVLSAAWLLAASRCQASVRGRLSCGKPNRGSDLETLTKPRMIKPKPISVNRLRRYCWVKLEFLSERSLVIVEPD